MKAFYIPAGLLIFILGFSLWAGRYVELRTEHWAAQLEAADAAGRQENWEEAGQRLFDAYQDWNSSQTFFHTIMDHDELDEAEQALDVEAMVEDAVAGIERIMLDL